jgi:hypothetical protein
LAQLGSLGIGRREVSEKGALAGLQFCIPKRWTLREEHRSRGSRAVDIESKEAFDWAEAVDCRELLLQLSNPFRKQMSWVSKPKLKFPTKKAQPYLNNPGKTLQ